jgi:hypothetical protein
MDKIALLMDKKQVFVVDSYLHSCLLLSTMAEILCWQVIIEEQYSIYL